MEHNYFSSSFLGKKTQSTSVTFTLKMIQGMFSWSTANILNINQRFLMPQVGLGPWDKSYNLETKEIQGRKIIYNR